MSLIKKKVILSGVTNRAVTRYVVEVNEIFTLHQGYTRRRLYLLR